MTITALSERALMHLLSSRFGHRVMRDLGLVDSNEPVRRLITQGIVMKDGGKMSKSLGNVVSPTDMIERFGADTVRMFMLFAAPPEKDIDWNDKAVEGQYRFLGRVWRTVTGSLSAIEGVPSAQNMEGLEGADLATFRIVHKTIEAVSRDIGERLMFNTAIARIMELVNHLSSYEPESEAGKAVLRLACESLATLLYPFAPHLGEQLWSELGHEGFLLEQPWPEHDAAAVVDDLVKIAAQVNGKLRATIEVARDADADAIKAAALAEEGVQRHIDGKEGKKAIGVPGRLVNFVVAR